MRRIHPKLTLEEISRAVSTSQGPVLPPVISPRQLAKFLGLSPKTIYEWIAKGRLDGSFRKRGKHILIWRDRAIALVFNGKGWTNGE